MTPETKQLAPRFGTNYRPGYIGFTFPTRPGHISEGITWLTRWDRMSDIKVSHTFLVVGLNTCIEAELGRGVTARPLTDYFGGSYHVYFRKPRGLHPAPGSAAAPERPHGSSAAATTKHSSTTTPSGAPSSAACSTSCSGACPKSCLQSCLTGPMHGSAASSFPTCCVNSPSTCTGAASAHIPHSSPPNSYLRTATSLKTGDTPNEHNPFKTPVKALHRSSSSLPAKRRKVILH